MNDTQEAIRQFVWTNYIQGKFDIDLNEITRLRTSGLLDSLAALGLISFVEKAFKIEFSALDLTVDNFDTIEQIASLVEQKKK